MERYEHSIESHMLEPHVVGPWILYEDAAARIAELEAALAAEREANRWIPVSERLPECTLHVVACQTPFSPFVACYVPGEGTWYDDDGIELDFIPTHWRELPAPPQEAADDK